MSENQSIIDILIAVDGETLAEKYPGGTPEKPNVVADPLIFLIADSPYVSFGQASKELKISVKTLDAIRWRSTTLSLNSAYFCLLYDFKLVSGGNIISTPEPLLAEVTAPLPDPSSPLSFTTQKIWNYFWNSSAVSKGEATYTFYFMILDRENNPLGYYYWDPFIQISE